MKPPADTPALLARLATLSDLARLRMLRLLDREELSVGELGRALQLPQSTVSRHLKMLHESGWLAKRSEGTASLYRVDESALGEGAGELWEVTRRQLAMNPTFAEDDARLREVLAERRMDSRAFFGRIGGEWDELRQQLFGIEFTAEALLSLIDPDWVVADLGCGTGNATELLAPLVSRIIAVDREPAMLDAARKRMHEATNVEFRRGELTSLPLKDGEVDAAVVFLVLHHVSEPKAAIVELARTVRPGGMALIVDMVAHDRETYRQTMGHVHLGFGERELRDWAGSAGLSFIRYHRLRPAVTGKGPSLFAATLRR